MNLAVEKIRVVNADIFCMVTATLIISSFLEGVVPGFVTGIIDVRWLFLAMVITFIGMVISPGESNKSLDKVHIIFITIALFVSVLLLLVRIALQGNSLLVRLALILFISLSIITLAAVPFYDSRRRH